MPIMEKSKIHAFAKKAAASPMAASLLAQKRAAAKAPPPAPAKKEAVGSRIEGMEDEQQVEIFELVEEAAQKAEAGEDVELEDAIAGIKSEGPEDVPAWAEDAEKWKQAAEAVGLGIPGTEDKYDEPHVVAAYLYKMIDGPVSGLGMPEAPEAPAEEASDMAKPGAAAKALQARAAAKAPAPKNQAGESGDLKKLSDEAAKQAEENPDPELMEKLAGYDPERDGNPPAWAADEGKWEKAKKAVEPNWESYEQPWAVVATIYKNMGGELK